MNLTTIVNLEADKIIWKVAKIMQKNLICFLLSVSIIFLSGCAGLSDKSLLKSQKHGIGTILSGKTGSPVTYQEMLKDFEHAQVIYIGEVHTNRSHHRIQAGLIQDISSIHDDISVGIEMVGRSYQPVLDKWSKGELSEQSFMEMTHWYANWRYDFELYRDIFNILREKRIQVFGLNIPFHIPPRIATGGIDNLLPEDAKHMPKTITLTDKEHRAYIEGIFKMHKLKGRENFEYFYEAQCTWEDIMAETISMHLDRRKMIVLTGNGHILKKFGVPNRAFARTGAPFRTLYLSSAGTDVDLSYGDYIWITESKSNSLDHHRTFR